ncbi:MAG: CPBP family intramembrane glutamic endopeptidase [Pseudomonadota bacterium]
MGGAFKAFGWPNLSAGGSVHNGDGQIRLHILWRVWLLLELCLLYIGVPIVLYHLVHAERMPLFVLLPPVLLVFVIVLLWDRSFLLRRELVQGIPWRELLSIFAVFIIGGGMVAAYVQQEMPRAFLNFPMRRPETWQRVMTLYPLASVIVQELVYRTFFFHRYGVLFAGLPWVMIVLNGVLFGVAHMLFGNWVAVIGTAVIGCLLAYRYAATRSLWAVVIEHTLWGWLVFTVGLGGFFFTGQSNMPAWQMLQRFIGDFRGLVF